MVCLDVFARLEYVSSNLRTIARNAREKGDRIIEGRYIRYCLDFINDTKNAESYSEKLTLANFYEGLIYGCLNSGEKRNRI